MHKSVTLIAVGLCVVAWASSMWAQTQAVTGEVISVSCYLQNKKNVGKAGYVCALADMKWEGNPPGVLTADGKVYQLAGPLVAGDNAKVVPYLGKTVTITGGVSKEYGMLVLTANDDALKMANTAAQ